MKFLMNAQNVLNMNNGSMHEELIYRKGGGGGTTTSSTGFAQEYKPQITDMLAKGKGLYDSGNLGSVAGFNATQEYAQGQGVNAGKNQIALENALGAQASKGVDLSGMRAGALSQAQSALGTSNNNASMTGNIGGSRQQLSNTGVTQDLAAKFAGIDQTEQATNFANKQAALGVQGTGANTLAGIGAGQQQQSQNQADAAYKGLSQYASLFHGVADKSTTTTQSGGK